MNNIHIIAEAGTNNNGRLDKALELVDMASRCGADSIKFQIIYTNELYLPGNYEYGHYDINKVRMLRDKGIMTDADYENLHKYCVKTNIPFTASIFDSKGLELMIKLKAPYIKIASGDLNHLKLLRQVADTGKRIILSTGMSTLQEIDRSLNEIFKHKNNDVVLMHCISVYPAQLRQTNLRFIEVLKKTFGLEVGFSDHTEHSIAACIALTLGATWFEKHFTADRSQEGLDHKYAMEEVHLKQYINDLHEAHEALKLKKEKVSPEELYTQKRARRSLYASRNIKAGEIIKDNDILIVRPENTMGANDYDLLIGSVALVDIKQFENFSLNKVKQG
ncbi:MAG: hypothetical protein A2381_00970 [Bdellovibrionales bacterium RIFOXYB1_FULL_37_110]|nr:MAG: hypothetical protein A2417_01825 [Bdellovibrionales bacterium RIFOXYC1_FULL_37_79]OFZ58790.1 MAG: hypothetical protein A2381_00970 [Bdellovibrionales bacterium RIFOXYB1_FULL_37_110]OFZ64789.1 MAG: hypothetical protein A2577_06970 [Bdellovibrionales bacterium RIFOXYD1_FULL_36_51]